MLASKLYETSNAKMILCLVPTQTALLVCNAKTWHAKHHIEVQDIDLKAWIIFDAQVNVFFNPKAKVPSI